MPASKWYTAALVVQCDVLGSETVPLVDLQLHLLRATSADEAYARALAIGEAAEHSYENDANETVNWTFAGLHDLVELDEAPADGSEVYSSLSREQPDTIVCDREQLTVFALEGAEDLTAREMFERLEAHGHHDDDLGTDALRQLDWSGSTFHGFALNPQGEDLVLFLENEAQGLSELTCHGVSKLAVELRTRGVLAGALLPSAVRLEPAAAGRTALSLDFGEHGRLAFECAQLSSCPHGPAEFA